MHDTLSFYTSRLDHDSEHTVNLFWGANSSFPYRKRLNYMYQCNIQKKCINHISFLCVIILIK